MKTYLLLRNNHQSGPYTTENLQQLNLKMFDLIWVEGESIMWKYPSEIREFQHFVPQADMTEGTRVNNIKEKQIRYFQSRINEMGFRTTNIQFIQQPDAMQADVPAGYEYLVMAQNYKIADDVVKYNDKTEEAVADEALIHVKQLLTKQYDFTVLGAAQLIDTPEVAADASFFTSTIDMPVRYKRRSVVEEKVMSAPGKERKNITPGIAGWLTVIAAAFMHFKL